MANNYLLDKEPKRKPHLLYSVILLIIGLAFVASWTHVRHQEIEMQKQQTAKQEIEEQNRSALRLQCMVEADKQYNEFLKLNGKKIIKEDGSIVYRMDQSKADIAERYRKDVKELCFKKYPISK